MTTQINWNTDPYLPHTWATNDIIEAAGVNRIENGLGNTDAKLNVLADTVAEPYDINETYTAGNYVIFEGKLYYCTSDTNTPFTIGWQQVHIMDAPGTAANIATVAAKTNSTSAEVVGIRTGADGTVYASAGEAVRGQIENIINRLPIAPETNGAYVLQCNVNNNEITYEWISV